MKLICNYCGRAITGKYLLNHWGETYCAEHRGTVPICDYCGRFIGVKSSDRGKRYGDGRNICGICLPRTVTTITSGKKILQNIHDRLENRGIIIKPFKPDFFLIERSRLKQLDKGGEKQGFATFRRQIFNGEIKSFNMEIFILNGLPEENFISTCAHELMHIWFYSHNITDPSPALIEGSCNMASFLMLSEEKTLRAEYVIKGLFADTSRTYGAGFRKIHNLVDKKGIPGWLEYISSHKRI